MNYTETSVGETICRQVQTWIAGP